MADSLSNQKQLCIKYWNLSSNGRKEISGRLKLRLVKANSTIITPAVQNILHTKSIFLYWAHFGVVNVNTLNSMCFSINYYKNEMIKWITTLNRNKRMYCSV